MDETRNRYILSGVLVGAVTVGLIVLARKTPPDQWASTLRRVAGDALHVVKERYGPENQVVGIAEKALDQFDESGEETALSRAFQEAVEKAHNNG